MMRPRKRDKETETKKQEKPDHELFIQAYEKPTQIYKFLRARFKHSPYFQYRNLTYMSKKPKKHKSSRKDFKLDTLLPRIKAQTHEASLVTTKFKFLNIKFLGFFSKEGTTEPVKVETLLLKILNKKRKESNCPVKTKSFGFNFTPSNPPDSSSPVEGVTIPTESFSLSNGHSVKSYHLLLRVGTTAPNGFIKTEPEINSPPTKKRKVSTDKDGKNYEFHYGTNLAVYDKRNRCLLPDGDYQLLLQELSQNSPKLSHVNTSWETIPDKEANDMSLAFENFAVGHKLKLRLCWTNNPEGEDNEINSNGIDVKEEICNNNNISNKENNNPDNNGVTKFSSGQHSEESNVQIVYQFLYSNNSRQQTEPHRDFYCPWCPKLDCLNLYSLLKHLKLCHARFTFSYTEITNGARIDVALNEKYDGSYIGTSKDISHGNIGFGISKRGPVRRAPVSKILVCHPKRPRRLSLSEFLNEKDDNDGLDGQRAYISGHNRLYHHTTTCLAIYPEEMDVDSEDESDPRWLQKKTTMMIDDFTDVNDGEKELMKMWNLHVMKYGFVGDCQIPLACNMFLETRGQELVKKNLYRNFVLHLCNLFDFGLISPVTVYTTIQRLQEIMVKFLT